MKKGLIIGLVAALVLGLATAGMAVEFPIITTTPQVVDITEIKGDYIWGSQTVSYYGSATTMEMEKGWIATSRRGDASVQSFTQDNGGDFVNFASYTGSKAIGGFAVATFSQDYDVKSTYTELKFNNDFSSHAFVYHGDVSSGHWTETGSVAISNGLVQQYELTQHYQYSSSGAGTDSGIAWSEVSGGPDVEYDSGDFEITGYVDSEAASFSW